jgi:poly [ADP-ribose] polymerase
VFSRKVFLAMSATVSRVSTAPSTPKEPIAKRPKGGAIKPVAEVDIFVPERSLYRVINDPEHQIPCTAMLNQTNLAQNNNKFFLIQALERIDGTGYASWFRWGRVGYSGQTNLQEFVAADDAIKTFMCKFCDKTLNDWAKNVYKSFKPHPNKYTLLAVETLTETKEAADSRGAQVEVVKVEYEESKLEDSIFNLVKLISSKEMFESELRIAGIDLTRMPLGRISSAMIKEAYKILNQIEAELLRPGCPRREELAHLSGRFYTVIPHSFGFTKAISFLINSFDKLREKSELLESLAGVRDGVDSEDRPQPVERISRKPNPVDESYARLGFKLDIVPRGSREFELIQKYKDNTQGETHSLRTSIRNIYRLSGPGDAEAPKGKRRTRKAVNSLETNKKLLWHGSRLTNWMSILACGLKIAPPEAPHTGYMFGKGIYTADCFSKAANYCFITDTRQRTGLVVLCEVSLGNPLELMEADYEAESKLGSRYESTKGVGKWFPDPTGSLKLEDGVEVPCGSLISLDKKEDKKVHRTARTSSRIASQAQQGLLYNEYIVYKPEQVRMKYLVELDFSR